MLWEWFFAAFIWLHTKLFGDEDPWGFA